MHNGTSATWTSYDYLKNLQGDILGICSVSGGGIVTILAAYEYDPWGKLLGVRNNSGGVISDETSIALRNPLRYRGYYYDSDTGYYYLKSRYYDPQIGRFINGDSQLNAKDGTVGYNLFAFCNNNPIINSDHSGHSITLACIIVGAVIGALAGGHIAAKVSKKKTGKVNGWAVTGGIIGGGVVGGLVGWGVGSAITATGVAATGVASTASAPAAGKVAEKVSTAMQTYYPPNNGFSGAAEKITLNVGTIIQRTGDLSGRFTAPANTPTQMLSLPFDKLGQATTYFQVMQPTEVLNGVVAPWFNQIGGGIQYLLLDGNVEQLLADGVLKILE